VTDATGRTRSALGRDPSQFTEENMMSSRFVYVTYIRTTPTKLWEALTKPEFTRQFWYGIEPESDWRVGSPWRMRFPDGRIADTGEVVAVEPEKRLVLKWQNEFKPELKAEGFTTCTFDIVAHGDVTELRIVHEIDRDGSKMVEAVSNGWPKVLSELKSLLETGKPLHLETGPRH
jgi:uncharacterized protein YndB with AHSA1/START domain